MNIKELAEQATFDIKDEFGNWINHGFDREKFAELAAAAEREECAKTAENFLAALQRDRISIADAIRARSKA